MYTEKLFYNDCYLKEFDATVLSCIKSVDYWEIILDKTAFFPEGGGQKADVGYIGDAFILDVQETPGGIIHYSEKEVKPGEKYTCSIDWDVRFSRMQQHSGEHIISGVVHSVYGYDNVGFHMDEDYITIDFNGELNRQQLDEIEDKVNDAIYQNYAISCFFPDEKSLSSLDYRSKLELTENVRLVKIENIDLCACCAPHVSRTGEVGIVKILDFMRHRGGVRLIAKCGRQALLDYRNKYRSVYDISNMLSAKQEEVFSAVERVKNETENIYKDFHSFKINVAEQSKKSLVFNNDVSYIIVDNFDADMMRTVANYGMDKSTLCVVFSGNDGVGYSYVAGSKSLDMKNVAKVINQALSGRGGGRDTMIQGKASSCENDIRKFMSELVL